MRAVLVLVILAGTGAAIDALGTLPGCAAALAAAVVLVMVADWGRWR